MRRGRFLRQLEEVVRITGSRDPDPDYEKTDQRIIILEDLRPRLEPEGFVAQDLRYIGNIDPPNFDIQINDLITRQPLNATTRRGASSGQLQVLTVENIAVVAGKQQLQLKDQNRPVR